MRVVRRDPDKGYLDAWLWVPKTYINVEGTKNALTHTFVDSYSEHRARVICLYKETRHHLLVPRSFWELASMPFPVVDCRPPLPPKPSIRSKITLDRRLQDDGSGSETLQPTGNDTQQRSMDALLSSQGGILQLACVAGDTVLNLNRGGKGFKTTIEKAFMSWSGFRYPWRSSIPTYIRSKIGDRIGLNRVVAFICRGERPTYKLLLDDGKELHLTKDHEVLTPTGYKALQHLHPGDEVVIDSTRKVSNRKKRVAYKRIGGFKHHPFARYQSRSWCIEEHRAIVEADINDLTLVEFRDRCKTGNISELRFINPNEFHIHHKDENVKNNKRSNLEILSVEDHLKHHRPGASAFGYGEPQAVRIKSIQTGQLETVYDVVCEAPHHNFIANGVVVHNCGKGKTVVALDFIARYGGPAIIVIDNSQLLVQWKDEIEFWLDLPDSVGLIKSDVIDWRKSIVLATYQTLGKIADRAPEEMRRYFRVAIFEEGHHSSATTFAPTLPMFYGHRTVLSATPKRDDGLHIIYDMHVGPVVYKDLKQDLTARVAFDWTGLEPDETRAGCDIRDKSGEIHGSKLAVYYGKWAEHLNHVLLRVWQATQVGRKVLVLCNSVDEAVNLCAIWNGMPDLYTDIPKPTPQDVNETLEPIQLSKEQQKIREREIKKIEERLSKGGLSTVKADELELQAANYRDVLKRCEIHQKMTRVLNARKKDYLKRLEGAMKTGGLMIYKVDPNKRQKDFREKQVMFAIKKYGKEGLNSKALDTIIVTMPFSSSSGLQQVKGRTERKKPGKKAPLLLVIEHNIGHVIGMCKKLRGHLRDWPIEEGGPFDYELHGHPKVKPCQISLFG